MAKLFDNSTVTSSTGVNHGTSGGRTLPTPTVTSSLGRDFGSSGGRALPVAETTKTPVVTPQTTVSYGTPTNYYDDLMNVFMKQNSDARDAALQAILNNLDAVKGTYRSQIDAAVNEYDKLINQNEVAKDRTRRVIRENQANRGQLDSGLGRQERLNMNVGYDNKTMDIKLAREQAVREINNLIAQAEAEANTNRANVNNNYNNALLQYQAALR